MNNVDKWFGPLASIIVTAAIGAVGFYVSQGVQKGTFPWWPYPAFALLIIIIFAAYGFLTKEPSTNEV